MARATKAEITRRIELIAPLLVECLSLREIRATLAKHTGWGATISEAQLKRYLAAAAEQIRAAAPLDRPLEGGAAKLRYERIIAKAAAKGDLRAELAANKALCELRGLEAAKRSEVAHSGTIDIAAVRTTLEQELAEMIAAGSYTPSADGDDDEG